MRAFALLSLPILVFLAGCVELTAQNPDPNHTHSDFLVMVNGAAWDFSAPRYMSDHPADDGHLDEHGTYLNEVIHLHDGDGTVMHAHKPGVTIGEFLASLKWQYAAGCLATDTAERFCAGSGKDFRMIVNGQEVPFDLSYAPNDLDRWLISFGDIGRDISAEFVYVGDRACISSRVCPWRGEAKQESCVADPNIPCRLPQS